MNSDYLHSLTPSHIAALNWFREMTGQDIRWPAPLDGVFLVNRAKGIHKPKGMRYALSARLSLDGPYEDALHWTADGSWCLKYHYEGNSSTNFTNLAMNECRLAGIPVGVMSQIKKKPYPVYRVLGLGLVTESSNDVFTIRQYGSVGERIEGSIAIQYPTQELDAVDSVDARLKTMRALAIRRGQPAFRRELLSVYGGACCVSACSVNAVLEAAHIMPYRGDHTNSIANGILLRADLHALFDIGLLRIEPDTYIVRIANSLVASDYFEFNGKPLRLPPDVRFWPDRKALRFKYELTAHE